MVLTNEDKIFIKNLLIRGYKVFQILQQFPDNNLKKSTIYDFARMFQETGTIERRRGSGRPRSVRVEVRIYYIL